MQDSDLIIHAGDIGNPLIIDGLKLIAPVVAVRGNMDNGGWATGFKRSEIVEIPGHVLYILHDVSRIDLDPAAAHVRAVIYGHTHRPVIEKRDGVLYVNPGSAGHRRHDYPVSMGQLSIKDNEVTAEIVIIEP